MGKPNKAKVLKNLEHALSRIILDGLVWEKNVSKGSGCGLICVPKELVGKRLKVILIPIDENDSLSSYKKIAIANEDMRNHNAQKTKLVNRKKKLEASIDENKGMEDPDHPADLEESEPDKPEEDLEEDDAY